MKFDPQRLQEFEAESPRILAVRYNELLDLLEEVLSRITVKDNMSAVFEDRLLIGGRNPYYISTDLPDVKAVFLVGVWQNSGAPLTTWPDPNMQWSYDGEKIIIEDISNLTADTEYSVRFLVLGE